MEDQHIYHHYEKAQPSITLKVEKNTKGFNYEAAVSGCSGVAEAMALIEQAIGELEARFGKAE